LVEIGGDLVSLDFLKKGYYFFEDKYYGVLDRINRVAPVYKVVDPVDKVFPSFALLLVLFAALILFAAWAVFPLLFPIPVSEFSASIRVMDSESEEAIKDAVVTITLLDSNESFSDSTNSEGIANFDLEAESVQVSVEITSEGYQRYFKPEMELLDGDEKELNMRILIAAFEEKISVIVIDAVSRQRILDRPITLTFTTSNCENNSSIPSLSGMQDDQVSYDFVNSGGCDTINAKAEAEGYDSRTFPLFPRKLNTLALNKLDPEPIPSTGSISVTVTDSAGTAEEGIEVRLFDSDTEYLKAKEYSTESGDVLFTELNPGTYNVYCDAFDGRTKLVDSIEVLSGETTTVPVSLPAQGNLNKKIYFKVKDKNTNEPVATAHASIRMASLWFKSVDVNSNGTARIPVSSSDADKTFSATISAEGYGDEIVELPVMDKLALNPTIVKLTPLIGFGDGNNLSPIAFFKPKNEAFFGAVPFTVEFDASDSYDPDGEIVSYDWNFEPASFDSGEEKLTVLHTFTQLGLYDVNLHVTDNNGATSSFSVLIQVIEGKENWAPVAIIDVNEFHGLVPLSIEFSGEQSFDPDWGIVFYRWDFGDGSTEEGVTKSKLVHSFGSAGEYTVSLEVEDDKGATAIDSIVIQAYTEVPANIKPFADFFASSYHGAKPFTVEFDASASLDADGSISKFDWNFGDGVTAVGVKASHTFNSVGVFDVVLKVTDNKGGKAERSRLIEVKASGVDILPVAVITSSTLFGQKPLLVDFSGEKSFDPDGSIKKFEWSFGLGDFAEGEVVSHIFEESGTYIVSLDVTDNSNNVGSTSVLVQVTDWDVPTHGDILVKVLNPNGDPVPGALVTLYQGEQNLTSGDTQLFTGVDGTYLFTAKPVSLEAYYAKAFADPGFSGQSDPKIVIPAQEIELIVNLSANKGKINVLVKEGEIVLSGVEVSFLDSVNGSVLDSCTTTVDGNCESIEIEAGKKVLVSALKSGYLTDQSNEITIIADNTHKVEIDLVPAITGVEAEFQGVFSDAACSDPAPKLISHSTEKNFYYFKFLLKFGNSVNKDARFNVRAGTDSIPNIQLQNYTIDVVDVLGNSTDADTLATCIDPTHPFIPPAECVGPGDHFKTVVAAWNELKDTDGVSKTVIVKMGIEPGVSNGTKAEFHFGAMAEQDGQIVASNDTKKEIEIGSTLCPVKDLSWIASIDIGGLRIAIPSIQLPADYIALEKGKEYDVYLKILNCLDSDLTDFKVTALDHSGIGTLSFPVLGAGSGPHEIQTIALINHNQESVELAVKIKAEKSSSNAELLIEGSSAETGSEIELHFLIDADKQLKIEGLPNSLLAGIPVTLTGSIKEITSSNPVNSASITVLNGSTTLGTVSTQINGSFSFQQSSGPNPAKSDSITIRVTAPGYAPKEVSLQVIEGGQPSLLDCVSIDPVGPTDKMSGESGSFNVKSNNCPAFVNVSIASPLNITQSTFVLDKTDSKAVNYTVTGQNIFQGIYSIEVRGTLEGSSTQRHIGVHEVRVGNTDSCFELDKFEFDLSSGSATATIKNKSSCFFSNRDALNPFIGLDNASAELRKTADKDKLPANFSFTWSITSHARKKNGSEFSIKSVERTESINPTASNIIFDLEAFNAMYYLEGSNAEGISGLKESPSYTDGELLTDIWFSIEENSDNIEVFIEGDRVKAKFHGQLDSTGVYPVQIVNKSLPSTAYAFISIEDLVSGGGD